MEAEEQGMSEFTLDPSRTLIGYLVRHGELNIKDRWDGWGNFVLSAEGRESIEKTAQWLSFERLGRLITSDLPRAYQSAEIIMSCCDFSCPFMGTDPNLRAWAIGKFTGKKKTDEARAEFQYYRDNPSICVPEGESWLDMQERIKVIYQYLCVPYNGLPTVCVIHNSVLKGILDLDEKGDVVEPGGIVAVYLNAEGKIEYDVVLGATKIDVGSGMGNDSSCG
jgi:broad specificity phosphatase PhoE